MLYSDIQMMRLKKLEQKSKLVNVSQGYVYTKFACANTRARTMGPSPSKRKQAGGAASAMHLRQRHSAFSQARMSRLKKKLHIYK